jgi:hypothetical protein
MYKTKVIIPVKAMSKLKILNTSDVGYLTILLYNDFSLNIVS